MFAERTRYSPKQMIEAIQRVAHLPGAEADKDALLDVVRVLAELTVSKSRMKHKALAMHTERVALGITADLVKPDGP